MHHEAQLQAAVNQAVAQAGEAATAELAGLRSNATAAANAATQAAAHAQAAANAAVPAAALLPAHLVVAPKYFDGVGKPGILKTSSHQTDSAFLHLAAQLPADLHKVAFTTACLKGTAVTR